MIVSRYDNRRTYELSGPAYDCHGKRRPGWVWARRTDVDATASDYHVRAFIGTTDADRKLLEEME